MLKYCLVFCATVVAYAADKPDAAKAKKGLQELGEFVGTWNLTADSKTSGKLVSWKETVNISWKFKGDDAWLAFDIVRDKMPASGELRYDPAKKQYTLKLAVKETKDAATSKDVLLTGELKRGKLTLSGKDAATSDVTRLSMNTISDSIRLSMTTELQEKGSGPFETITKAVGNKEGESLAGGGSKKPECIITGGTASIAVSYMGKTYYVCCTGCRDEFNEYPKKYVDAYEKAKK